MKTKMMITTAALSLFAFACGNAEHEADLNTTIEIETTVDLDGKLEQLNTEIEAIEAAEAEVEATINELNQI